MKQAEALTVLKTGANVFLTGEPGSGKTHTINTYLAYLRSCGIEPAVTASTGIAATHVGGMTIHAWSGIGVRRELSNFDLDKIAQNERVAKRVSNTQVLIIDEVSMLSGSVLTMIELVCRTIRRKNEPFGGMQVVLVGDFFQLPPIVRRGEEEVARDDTPYIDFESGSARSSFSSPFAYNSSAWKALNLLVCYLSEQYRQEDPIFLGVLSAIRRGAISPLHYSHLGSRRVKTTDTEVPSGITKLYSHNVDVDRMNDNALSKLSSEVRTFQMRAKGAPPLIEALKRNCLSPEVLKLKAGAKVMFTKNDPEQKFVNGTTGDVVGFDKVTGFPIIKTKAAKTIQAQPMEWSVSVDGRSLAEITQVPLRLAWAITVHKSQGMSLDSALIDLSQAFEYGQGYVALSRVRSLSGLHLLGWNDRALEVHPEVLEKDGKLREYSQTVADKFFTLKQSELTDLHNNFVRACGGKAGAGPKVYMKKKPGATYDATRELVEEHLTLKEMAKKRGMTTGTILAHLEKLIADGEIDAAHDLAHFERPRRFDAIKKAFKKVSEKENVLSLSSVRNLLGTSFTYDELRLARLFIKP